MIIKIFIIDDDIKCIEDLQRHLKSFPFIGVQGSTTDINEAIKTLQSQRIDLLFLDIEMGDVNGIELAKHIKSLYPDILIIFATGHPGFALKGYEVYPVDFLTKPINILRLEKALKKVREVFEGKSFSKDLKIGMNISGGIKMINLNEIIYIEKQGRKVALICKNDEILYSNDTMENLEDILLPYEFYRTHQSFIVLISRISGISPDKFTRSYSIELKNIKKTILLSRNKYTDLKNVLEQHTRETIN